MTDAVTESEKLQQKVDRLKALSLTNNIHSLTPPSKQSEPGTEVAIINALKAGPMIMEYLMQLSGYMINPLTNEWQPFRTPVMNPLGVGNFIITLWNIATSIEWSNYKEEEINSRIKLLFRSNYPYYTIYADDYELDKEDFNLIKTMLFTIIDTSYHKAKGAGHRNVARATYSEDLLGKAVGVQSGDKPRNVFEFLQKNNPFARKK